MDKRLGSSAGLVALLALLLHTFTGSPGEKPARPAAVKRATGGSSSDAKAAKILGSEGPWRATQQYFNQDPGLDAATKCSDYLFPTAGTKPTGGCDSNVLRSLYAIAPNVTATNLSTLIATIPDPLHTRLSVETDRYLDAVQQAAFRSGWELATQWLPWTLKGAEAAPATALHLGPKEVDVEELPGLLVFRRHFVRDAAASDALLIFVVGETPTAGINGYQFEVARRTISMLGSKEPDRIKIVGPNFSGSFPSLTRLVQSDPNPHHYEMRGGAVSNLSYGEKMLQDLAASGYHVLETPPALQSGAPVHPSVSYHGSNLPSRAFDGYFHDLKGSWHYSDPQVAELIEDETGFSFRDPHEQIEVGGKPSHDSIITYRYPRDVAQLRNAYSDIAPSNGQKPDDSASPGPDLSLKDSQAGEDTFPIFSGNHTPVSQNAVLEQIVRDLNRKSIRLVSLSATNVFDTIFLAKVLARYCPNTRVVLNGADLLFVQESTGGSLAGLMAISAFPMFPDGNTWSRRSDANDVTTFSDSDSIAEFNAALALLSDEENYLKNRQAIGLPSQPRGNGALSAWLLVLSRYGWSPVKLLSQPDPEMDTRTDLKRGNSDSLKTWFDGRDKSTASQSVRALPKPSPSWDVLCVVVAAFILAFCGRLFYLKWNPQVLVWSALTLDDLRGRRHPISQIVHCRYLCLFSCLSALSFIGGLLWAPLMAASFVHKSPVTGYGLLLNCLGFLALCVPLGTSLYLCSLVPFRVRKTPAVLAGGIEADSPTSVQPNPFAKASAIADFYASLPKPEQGNQPAEINESVHSRSKPVKATGVDSLVTWIGGVLRVAILVFPLAGLATWWTSCSDGTDGRGWLLCFRALSLASPVSPILPLLLTAGAIFVLAFFHLRRFTWGDSQQPRLETSMFDESLWNQFNDLKLRLDRVLLSPTTPIRNSGAVILPISVLLATGLLLLVVPLESLRSFEPQRFELLLACMLLPLAVFATLTLVQFWACWSILRAFLVTLNSLVLGRYFTRLPDFSGSGPVWIREVKLMSLATAVNSTIALHNLEKTTLKTKPSLLLCRNAYWEALKNFLSKEKCERGRRDFIAHYAAFRNIAAEITNVLCRQTLQPYWQSHALPFLEDVIEDKAENLKETKTKSNEAVLGVHMLSKELAQDEGLFAVGAAMGGSASTLSVKAVPVFAPAALESTTKKSAEEEITPEAYLLASKYVALQYSAFIGYSLRHLQNLLLCCVVCFILSVLALNSFTFQAPQTLSYFLILALLVGAVIVVRVLAQVERDAILSRMSGTEEGELGKDFYLKVLAYGALPVLTVLGTQFPSLARFVSMWAEPTIAGVR